MSPRGAPSRREKLIEAGRARAEKTRAQLLVMIGAEPIERQLRVVIALEREAALRYLDWSDASRGKESEGLLACARREEEVARLIEDAAFAGQPLDVSAVELVGKAVALFQSMYDGLSREEQMAAQAPSERFGAGLWRSLRDADPAGPLAAAYLRAETLEDESGHFLEGLLDALP